MDATMRNAGSRGLGDLEDCSVDWTNVAQNRLDRLLELRAVVDSLRAEKKQKLLHYLHTQRDGRYLHTR